MFSSFWRMSLVYRLVAVSWSMTVMFPQFLHLSLQPSVVLHMLNKHTYKTKRQNTHNVFTKITFSAANSWFLNWYPKLSLLSIFVYFSSEVYMFWQFHSISKFKREIVRAPLQKLSSLKAQREACRKPTIKCFQESHSAYCLYFHRVNLRMVSPVWLSGFLTTFHNNCICFCGPFETAEGNNAQEVTDLSLRSYLFTH